MMKRASVFGLLVFFSTGLLLVGCGGSEGPSVPSGAGADVSEKPSAVAEEQPKPGQKGKKKRPQGAALQTAD